MGFNQGGLISLTSCSLEPSAADCRVDAVGFWRLIKTCSTMDSQPIVVVTHGGSDDNGIGQMRSGTMPNILEEPVDLSLIISCPVGKLQSSSIKPTCVQSNLFKAKEGGARSVPDVALTSWPALQDTGELCGVNQPITVNTGLPGVCEEPTRLTLEAPGLCRRPITDCASLSLTKDLPQLHWKGGCLEPRTVSFGTRSNGLTSTPVTVEADMGDVFTEAVEHSKDPFHRMETELCKRTSEEGDNTEVNDGSPICLPVALICNATKAERVGEREGDHPAIHHLLPPCGQVGKEQWAEEGGDRERAEGEVLDLSLPKKRDSKERRLWHESSLLMEVDEVEGVGDRDIVEEDDGDDNDSIFRLDGADIFGGFLVAPSCCSPSLSPCLSSLNSDSEGVLLIDDQGIPYTLTTEGLKVPQIDSSKQANPPSSPTLVTSSSMEIEDNRLSYMTTARITHISHSLVNSPHAQNNNKARLSSVASVNPAQKAECINDTAPLMNTQGFQNLEPHKVLDTAMKPVSEARGVVSQSSGSAVQTPQPLQIVPNPSTNPPMLFLSSITQSSTPLAMTKPGLPLSLPLSLLQNSTGASTSMFLLLSPSTSSSLVQSFSPSTSSSLVQSFSPSTPLSLVDPCISQLSQVTACLSPLSLSSCPAQMAIPELSLPGTLSQATNPVPILSGASPSANPLAPVPPAPESSTTPSKQPGVEDTSKAVPSSSPPIKHTGPSSSDPQSVSTDRKKTVSIPNGSSTTKASPLEHPQVPPLTFDPVKAVDQLNVPDPEQTSLPWNDHLYFSSPTVPPSPPLAPSCRPSNLDPLDVVSPASPPSSGPRKVLYCHLCPRIFYYLSDLERHSITHSQNKPHVCQQCGKAFKRSSHLQRHNHIHTGQRNFMCPICSKRFREAGELQRHQRVHTGEKPFQCSLCHTRFAERNTLRRHTKRKHPYHHAAVEMLAGLGGDQGGGDGDEGTEEWYSSTVSNLENSDSEPDSEVIS
ncbi:hypothetical protein UPYG_G00153630 [Umbra pygmaea]|uniref:C2H2-type domain-containing protein n=1 Tax=Umbra pygmaea TaxID=75934 RepID=A0ABD0X1P7_UMBPY